MLSAGARRGSPWWDGCKCRVGLGRGPPRWNVLCPGREGRRPVSTVPRLVETVALAACQGLCPLGALAVWGPAWSPAWGSHPKGHL